MLVRLGVGIEDLLGFRFLGTLWSSGEGWRYLFAWMVIALLGVPCWFR